MNMYAPKDTDDIVISLKEYFKNNPFNEKDHQPDGWIVIPSAMKGQTHSEETRLKISAANKGRIRLPHSEESKLKMSESHKGRELSIETKLKLSAVLKGKTAWNKGLKSSPETISKLSTSQKNRLKNGQPESQKLAAKKAMTENNKRTMVCDKCGKINNLGNHKRWHGDKCGIKTFRSEETKQKISKSMSDHIKSAGRSEKQKLSCLESNKKRKGKKYPNGYKTKNKILDVS